MIPFNEIDARLEGIGKNRAWLVQVTGRSDGSIRSGLAPNAPEEKRSALLQKALSMAIEEEEARQKAVPIPMSSLGLIPTADDFDRWCAAYKASEHETLIGWAVASLNAAAAAWAKSQPARPKPEIAALPDPAPAAVKLVPHLEAAAGSPLPAEVEDWDGEGDTILVRVNGLSMEPLFHDGDVIRMTHRRASRSPFMKKGLVYLVAYDGGYTIKEYATRPARADEQDEEWVERGRVKTLISRNKAFAEIIVKAPAEWVAWYDPKSPQNPA